MVDQLPWTYKDKFSGPNCAQNYVHVLETPRKDHTSLEMKDHFSGAVWVVAHSRSHYHTVQKAGPDKLPDNVANPVTVRPHWVISLHCKRVSHFVPRPQLGKLPAWAMRKLTVWIEAILFSLTATNRLPAWAMPKLTVWIEAILFSLTATNNNSKQDWVMLFLA